MSSRPVAVCGIAQKLLFFFLRLLHIFTWKFVFQTQLVWEVIFYVPFLALM